ncbi:acyl-homoserine-lactone synthase [Tranquillimonas rosea]|uniref:acyl-homoserine-lactone synthase n=1 Tax=Tranquillimonas rosea TaxID=641238 RepID=UPI003BAA1D5D
MIRFLYAGGLNRYPRLRDSMFRDRAAQFADRLGWEVHVDDTGAERDAYDAEDPLYVIWEGPDGRHAGSMRFLPTTGRTMLSDHFAHLLPDGPVCSPRIWECTRFCIAPGAAAHVPAALLLGALEMGLELGLSHGVGVFDARMLAVYRRLGWPPAPLGTAGPGRAAISAGMWRFAPEVRPRLLPRAGISPAVSRHWVERGFGRGRLVLAA